MLTCHQIFILPWKVYTKKVIEITLNQYRLLTRENGFFFVGVSTFGNKIEI